MEQQFNIQIVEDELLVALDISERLKQAGYSISSISDNMKEAIAAFKQHMPDLVLLDININGRETGIDIANAISEIQPTPFIYVTAHADAVTVHKAKNTFPAAYVVKPYTTNSLLVSVELALHNFAYRDTKQEGEEPTEDGNIYLRQNYIFIKDGFKFVKLFPNDILYLSAENNYVKILTAEKKTFLVRNTLTKIMEILKRSFFVRVHRSFCVNTNHIDAFSEHEVSVGGHTIPVGRMYKHELMQTFRFR